MGEDCDSPGDVVDVAAARKVGDDVVEALQDGAGDGEAGDLFEDFVDQVAGIEVGSNEDVGLAGDRVGFGVGSRLALAETDTRVDGGVELHFSGDEHIAIIERPKSFLDNVNRGVLAATTKSGEGEQGDAGLVGKEFLGGSIGLLDDFAELIGARMLTGGHVGKKIKFGIAAHDGEAGESLIRVISFGVGRHCEVVAAGEDNVASGMLDAGNHSVSGASLDHLAGSAEVGCGEGGDCLSLRARGGLVVSGNGCLDSRVVELGEDNLNHDVIITYVSGGCLLCESACFWVRSWL